MKAQQWEYFETVISDSVSRQQVRNVIGFQKLQAAGNQGWELVSTFTTESMEVVGIFKRPKGITEQTPS